MRQDTTDPASEPRSRRLRHLGPTLVLLLAGSIVATTSSAASAGVNGQQVRVVVDIDGADVHRVTIRGVNQDRAYQSYSLQYVDNSTWEAPGWYWKHNLEVEALFTAPDGTLKLLRGSHCVPEYYGIFDSWYQVKWSQLQDVGPVDIRDVSTFVKVNC